MLTEFSQEEVAMLVDDGFTPGFMLDIQEGDLIAIAPVLRRRFDGTPVPVRTLRVDRILKVDGTYFNTDSNELVPHTVISFIGMNLDGLPEHCSYGGTYPCFYKREE